jgi:hypothetical protein
MLCMTDARPLHFDVGSHLGGCLLVPQYWCISEYHSKILSAVKKHISWKTRFLRTIESFKLFCKLLQVIAISFPLGKPPVVR